MGMQCHFNIKELPDFTKIITYDYELEGYTYEIIPDNWNVDCSIEGNAWFDIGSRSFLQMNRIEYLIRNRVCFNCS